MVFGNDGCVLLCHDKVPTTDRITHKKGSTPLEVNALYCPVDPKYCIEFDSIQCSPHSLASGASVESQDGFPFTPYERSIRCPLASSS